MKFRCDYSDPCYPTIRLCHPYDEDGVTFSAAKKEVLDTIRSAQEHWREYRKEVQNMKAADFKVSQGT